MNDKVITRDPQSTGLIDLQVELMPTENNSCDMIGMYKKKKLKEIIKRVYVGNYEDSKNVLLLSRTCITHIIIIRCSKEEHTARIIYPHKFEYYIIDFNEELKFTSCSHFKYLLDEILLENEKNKVFVHSYFSLKNILSLIIYYIVTTYNSEIEDAISYVNKLIPNFVIPIEDADKIYYFTIRNKLTYYPGECTSIQDIKDKK
ncbi:conserved Plasmodium protein, unknown function [Plasmodium malariae]|uniref:Uncharacterized protein n=1 Tax=Plasmodium malariae TaxID=5858 RepID=A0A1D3JM10_PLAMA|nr:conserved Plasmodium protein, unknown function [Plasmodium malariae]SBT87519.1 conserved Plasmodium protein, unknown function [Plasmodium malariae]